MPFLGFGLFAAYTFLFSTPSTHTSGSPIIGVMVALVFAAIGGGLMFGAVYGYRKQKQDEATKEANPDSPWLWRKDWAANRADSLKRSTIYGWWIGAGLVSMIVVPILVNVLPQLVRDSDPIALVLMGFALIPALLLVGAVRATIRRERYGKTYFEFGSLPFSPGSHLRGHIQLRLNTAADHGIDLRLSCIRRIVTNSGKNRTTNDAVLWKDEKNVPQSYLSVGPLGTAMPVDFAIPEDGYETNHERSDDQLLWVLHAQADVPGVDYSDDFEVPVFRTSASSARDVSLSSAPSFSTEPINAGSFAAATAPAFQSDSSDVTAPARPRVVVSTTTEGDTEFYFPPFRNRGQTLGLFLFTAVWTAIVYFLWNSHAPWLFAAVFGFFDLIMIYGCIQSAFGSTRIVVGHGKVTAARKIFGPGKPREFLFADIQGVLATAGLQQGKSGSNASCLVRLKTTSGKDFTLADNIADRQEARWVVAQIEKLVGLKQDTHVELADSFGRSLGPPPQRNL
jgi:hypothetical protein